MAIEIGVLFGDPSRLPESKSLANAGEKVVSPTFPGRLYDVRRAQIDGRMYAIKTLMPTATDTKRYPDNLSLGNIFLEHIKEHKSFLKHLEKFLHPSIFYVLQNQEYEKEFKIVQPWIMYGVQFKEAMANNRTIPQDQLPPLEERLTFVSGLTKLLEDEDVKPKITDIDFFIVPENGLSHIIIADTNFLWYPKAINDKRRILHNISWFLFSKEENKNELVVDALRSLENALDIEQLD